MSTNLSLFHTYEKCASVSKPKNKLVFPVFNCNPNNNIRHVIKNKRYYTNVCFLFSFLKALSNLLDCMKVSSSMLYKFKNYFFQPFINQRSLLFVHFYKMFIEWSVFEALYFF